MSEHSNNLYTGYGYGYGYGPVIATDIPTWVWVASFILFIAFITFIVWRFNKVDESTA